MHQYRVVLVDVGGGDDVDRPAQADRLAGVEAFHRDDLVGAAADQGRRLLQDAGPFPRPGVAPGRERGPAAATAASASAAGPTAAVVTTWPGRGVKDIGAPRRRRRATGRR